jgi:opacity protein-like surface antigen
MYSDNGNGRVRTAIIAAPLALALALFSPALAYAQVTQPAPTAEPAVQHPTPPPTGIVEPGAWTVTPLLGFGFGGNLENSPLAIGIATAYNWSPRVSFEGELGYTRSATQGVITPFDASVTTGSVNALYHFSAENWAPYATIGLGFGHANTDLSPFDVGIDANNTTMMVNFGGGVKTSLGERVNLRTGMRYYNGNDLVPSFWRPYVGLTFTVGQIR